VEIVKATSYNADVIIMDEPTSAITDREVEKLFEIIEKLKKQNKAIVYISHKMDEIYRIADYITVLRDGKYIDSRPASQLPENELVRLMVGRELNNLYIKDSPQSGDYNPDDVQLEAKDICADGCHHISF